MLHDLIDRFRDGIVSDNCSAAELVTSWKECLLRKQLQKERLVDAGETIITVQERLRRGKLQGEQVDKGRKEYSRGETTPHCMDVSSFLQYAFDNLLFYSYVYENYETVTAMLEMSRYSL